ncbi:MAG: type II 3-dehydroquinate dehydratase [Deltaproteobacteria bacterium]|nr:type II 3-dehydroquinate dehydratase [Deltaproteobacteria bacterium]
MPPSRKSPHASSRGPSPRKKRPKTPSGEGRRKPRGAYRILFMDGPNLNVLGKREPGVYGKKTLAGVQRDVTEVALREGASVTFFQSNHEGEIVTRLQEAREKADGLVINPGGYTHSSVAIRDALLYAGIPSVEVHLSNLARREPFRKQSLIEDVVVGRISGFGGFGYVLALHAILDHLRREVGIASR